jgi:hypothetical protein
MAGAAAATYTTGDDNNGIAVLADDLARSDLTGSNQTPKPSTGGASPEYVSSETMWKILIIVGLIVAIVALILGAVALGYWATNNGSNNAPTLYAYTTKDQVTFGNTTSGQVLVMLASASSLVTLPLSDADGGIAYIVATSGKIRRLYVTLTNVTLTTEDTTPTVTATVYRAVNGSETWETTDLTAEETVNGAATFYTFSNTATSVSVDAGDRLAVVLTAGEGANDTIQCNVAVSFAG